MAVNAGEAWVKMKVTGKGQVSRELGGMETRLKRFGGAMRAMGGRLRKGLAHTGGAALGGLTAGLIASVKAASDMQETMNKFNVVFGQSAGVMSQWADETAQAFGRSKKQVRDFLASSQDLLVPMGMNEQAAMGMSKQMTALAMDIASFNNKQDGDVMRDIQAALTGSGEVMKKYGVVLTEAAVKQELLNSGLDPANATAAQKGMARFNLILRGTTAAQGDVARSGGSFANQMKAIKAQASDLLVAIGERLLPVLEDWMADLSALMGLLSGGGSATDDMEQSVDGLAQSLEQLSSPVEMISRVIMALGSVFRFLQTMISQSIANTAMWVRLISGTGLAKTVFGDAASEVEGVAKAIEDDLRKLAASQLGASIENLDLAFGDRITESIRKAREEMDQAKEKAAIQFQELRDFSQGGKVTAPVVKAAQGIAKAAEQMVQATSPESLEASSTASLAKFLENKRNDELVQLKLIKKAIMRPGVSLVALGAS